MGRRGDARSMKVIYDDFFLKHRPPPGHPHPECPARVSTARTELDGLEGINWDRPTALCSEEGRAKTLAAIERVHHSEYLDEVRRVCARGGGAADFDTYICPDSFEVCVAASSAWMDAAESAWTGSPAFALARPPGHHATAGVGMGFCLVCFAAVAAFHALETLGCGRVAMLDFDVHHGNGVAALVKGEERIRYCSIHQGGIFPGSGGAEDKGPLGNLNHLPFFGLGETWETYEPRFEQALTWLQEFEPDLVIVSAGYDALEADELATASLQPEDYRRMGRRLREVFGGNVAFGLEGGYNLQVTPLAIRKTIEPFLGLDVGGSSTQEPPSDGKAPPAIGGGAMTTAMAVTTGGGHQLATFGNLSARAPTTPLMGAAAIAAATAGAGQELAAMFQRGAIINNPSPGPGAPPPPPPPPPRPPQQGGVQAAGRGTQARSPSAAEAVRAENAGQDRMEVTPASPLPSPPGAAAAAAAAPQADYVPDTWGFNGIREGYAPPPPAAREHPGPTGGAAAAVTPGASAQPANRSNAPTNAGSIMEDMNEFEFVFDGHEADYVGESIETDSMASLSDDRSPTYIVGGDGKKKVKWPRKNGRKVYSSFAHGHFPFEPADPAAGEKQQMDVQDEAADDD
eukprot:g16746.t1